MIIVIDLVILFRFVNIILFYFIMIIDNNLIICCIYNH